MCNMDCFHCQKPDCDNDSLTFEEEKAQDKRDRFALYDRKYGAERDRIARQKKYDASEKGKQRTKRYKQSEKHKEAQRRYNASEKGKERNRKHYQKIKQTEAGREAIRKRNQKAVASGKNAEYCRAYYYRQKEKKLRESLGKEQ